MLDFRRIIWIRRRDLIAQAVSLTIAMQTGAWTSFHKPLREPIYDYQAIADCADAIQHMESEWEKFIAQTSTPHLTLFYEDTLANEASTINSVLEWFGLPAASASLSSEVQKQSNLINTAWEKRFLTTARQG